jgi:hypothetical protein
MSDTVSVMTEETPLPMRLHLRSVQLQMLVVNFVVTHHKMPHVVLAADLAEAKDIRTRIRDELDRTNRDDLCIRIPTNNAEFEEHLEWVQHSNPDYSRVLILYNQAQALYGWRVQVHCGLSCTYLLAADSAAQLRARVARYSSSDKNPVLVGEMPTIQLL